MLNLLFFESLLIYTLFAVIMYNISIKEKKNTTSHKMPSRYVWCILIFALISGLRWDVGTDYLGYLQTYKDMRLGLELYRTDYEKGFELITKAFGFLHIHYSLYFAFWAFLQCYFIVKSVSEEKYHVVPYILLLIPLSNHYIMLMNGLRQMVVACSFLWSSKFIIEKDFKKYILWVFVCSFIHITSWLLLPLYFINIFRCKWDNSFFQFIILILCAILGSTPSWVTKLNIVEGFLDVLGYVRYSSQLDFITSLDAMDSYNWGPRKYSLLFLYIILIFSSNHVKRYFESPYLILCYIFFLLGAFTQFLFYNTSIFVRPTDYLVVFSFPVLGYTLYYYRNSGKLPQFYLLISVSFLYVLVSIYVEAGLPEDMRNSFLYQFCFSHWDIINNPIVRPH